MMNGDISRPQSGQSGTLEETLQQMNILIQENRDLKGESQRSGFRRFDLSGPAGGQWALCSSCQGGAYEMYRDKRRMAVDSMCRCLISLSVCQRPCVRPT